MLPLTFSKRAFELNSSTPRFALPPSACVEANESKNCLTPLRVGPTKSATDPLSSRIRTRFTAHCLEKVGFATPKHEGQSWHQYEQPVTPGPQFSVVLVIPMLAASQPLLKLHDDDTVPTNSWAGPLTVHPNAFEKLARKYSLLQRTEADLSVKSALGFANAVAMFTF